jgi:hypothetical protein
MGKTKVIANSSFNIEYSKYYFAQDDTPELVKDGSSISGEPSSASEVRGTTSPRASTSM